MRGRAWWPAGLTLALAAIVAAELWWGGAAEDSGASPEVHGTATDPPEAFELIPVFTLIEPDELASLAERPLFAANRRPPEPVVAKAPATKPEPPPPPQPRPEFVLSAIVRDGSRWIALVGTQGRGSVPPVEVEVGGKVAGWQVERIGANSVVLRRGRQRAELKLRNY